MTDSLARRLTTRSREDGLFPRAGLTLVGVSGGPDSAALLDLLSVAGQDLGLTLAVGHVDHGILPGSEDVAEAVLALATRYGVPGYLASLNLGADASETRARRERYGALRAMQRKLGAPYLATAHHADDQIETILFRVLRGSGPAGLAGIGSRGPNGLVRPLLPFRRAELADWLRQRRVDGRAGPEPYDDPANRDLRHDRSWLRARLLPMLRERFGERLDQRVLDLGAHAAAERRAWSILLRALPDLAYEELNGVVDVASAPLRAYDKTLSEALLRAIAREVDCTVGLERAARWRSFLLSGRGGARFELGGGWVAELAFDRMRLARMPASVAASEAPVSWGAGGVGQARWDGWEISWQSERAGRSTRLGETTWVSSVPGEIRATRRGDRIRPLGGTGRRPVRRLLMEARVPRGLRDRYPVLVRGGEIVWVPGVCRAAVDVPAPGAPALRVDARAG